MKCSALLFICAFSLVFNPSISRSLDLEQNGDWLQSFDELPSQALAELSDCPMIVDPAFFEADSTAFIASLLDGGQVIFVICSTGGNSLDAAVYLDGTTAHRVGFETFDADSQSLNLETTGYNIVWRGENDIYAKSSMGCQTIGSEFYYRLDKNRMVLEVQNDNTGDCGSSDFVTVYESAGVVPEDGSNVTIQAAELAEQIGACSGTTIYFQQSATISGFYDSADIILYAGSYDEEDRAVLALDEVSYCVESPYIKWGIQMGD